MSATNSRIAKLNRALRQLEDEYCAHKLSWNDTEDHHYNLAIHHIVRLITAEKLRRVA